MLILSDIIKSTVLERVDLAESREYIVSTQHEHLEFKDSLTNLLSMDKHECLWVYSRPIVLA